MKQTGTLMALAGLVSMVHGHGFVTSPKARMPGPAMKAACGNQVEINQQSDNYGNIQGELQVAKSQSDYNAEACNIWLCKGYKFDDNKDNVNSYTAGQKVDFTVDIRAPHTGVANVSVVDTTTNTVIGETLKSWTNYASTATGVSADETNFSVTIPDNLGGKCSEAGACVLQWYWFAESIDQTYESCIDFTVSGSGSGSGSGSTPSAPATSSSAAVTAAPTAAPTQATTMVTSVKQTSTAAAPSATAPSTSFPTDGSAEEKLTYIASLLQGLMKYLG
ncbi:lytic polysaccharide monooxygenase [Aspergillus clavatus NRRL 1]|uniref:Chitin binding protein, putative n=1 Tax=Aspergillus clavatus (strain ATCC 1007 / CBS 513.65 / DSM 816 / NCTC 3887 / NRRL 1 / QM 1276 / 107) TaxID=344612 RepID=A1CP20_ASPCL|nr:chitin binding protein, putative [Aspergillus clavatus NRRL 1]EAW07391.1 chitin binding protein, putative [Aspergillus clavatus NRRL 1]